VVPKFLESFSGLRTSDKLISKALATWLDEWRPVERPPPLHRLPLLYPDLRRSSELPNLKDKIENTYLLDLKDFEDREPDLKLWTDCLIRMLCYERSIQELIVKEKLQPGHYWSTTRNLDPLWVIGVHLPGAFGAEFVNTWDKIFSIVASLAEEILARTGRELMELFEQGIAVETQDTAADILKPLLG
jgi:hypothetical protein